jgi:hypothetical protein
MPLLYSINVQLLFVTINDAYSYSNHYASEFILRYSILLNYQR